MTQPNVVQEVDVLSILSSTGKKNKRLQAKLLQELEKHVDKNTEDYDNLRKFILDEVNSYTRSIMRDIFGDVEFMMRN